MDDIKERVESVDFFSDQAAQNFAIELYPENGIPQAQTADYTYYADEATYEIPHYYDIEASLSQIEQGIDPSIIMGPEEIEGKTEPILDEQALLMVANESENHPFILPKAIEESPDNWGSKAENAPMLERSGGARKQSHIAAEQRRRAVMKNTFSELKSMLSPEKRSKSAVLHAGKYAVYSTYVAAEHIEMLKADIEDIKESNDRCKSESLVQVRR